MPNWLEDLTVDEVSLVDRPANSEKGVPRARVALFKRDTVAKGKTEDGKDFPKSDYAYTPSDNVSEWKLRLTRSPGGSPDPTIVGDAVAALGKGFRGNKVDIPAEALSGVKAKVRAAWKAANPDKGEEDLPDVLISKGDCSMTVEQIQKRLEEQDLVLKNLTEEKEILKAENDLVIKMSGEDRILYASLSDDVRKNFIAGDVAARKTILAKAAADQKEADLFSKMDAAEKVDFEKAGPHTRAAMLATVEARVAKADKGDSSDDEDMDVDDMEKEKKAKMEKEKSDAMCKREQELFAKLDVVDSLTVRLQKAETELAEGRKQSRLLKFAKRAEEVLPHTPGSPEEKGDLLMKFADTLGDGSAAFEKVLGQLVQADQVLGSEHYAEFGKSGGAVPAESILMAKVEEIQKRDNISQSKAMEKLMTEQPAVYMDYEREKRNVVR